MFPGDHFFLHENEPAIVESIVAELGKSAKSSA
jgi:surfactin synthase thioesterase subunit